MLNRWRDESGVVETEAVILVPLAWFVAFFFIQFSLWMWATITAEHAAAHAVQAVSLVGGDPSVSHTALSSLAEERALDIISDTQALRREAGQERRAQVAVDPARTTATVQVSGGPQVILPIPGINWSVRATAQAPLERFVPATER